MSIPGGSNPLLLTSAAGGAGGGYLISRSVRFNSSDSAYLSRTPASAGNRRTWTFAFWAKRSTLGTLQFILATPNGANNTQIYFDGNTLVLYDLNSSVGVYSVPLFRDPSAWYHFVIAVDTTQATASDRVKMYANGVAVSYTGSITQNLDLDINYTVAHNIGARPGDGFYLDGYLADCYMIDGQQIDPSSFGEFSATTGVWVPKAFTGSYGSQGWHLEFADNSSNTATTLGKDTSGNGNNWTPNNLSVTAGAGNDSVVDVPTNGSEVDTGSGGQVRGNYCTWNPLSPLSSGATLSNGNLDVVTVSSGDQAIPSTIFMSSGKWYSELTITTANSCSVGIIPPVYASGTEPGSSADSYAYRSNALKRNNSTNTSYGATFTNGDVIGIALDLTGGTLVFYKNGVSQGTAFTGISGTFCFAFGDISGAATTSCTANFGQRPFAYPVSGFKALCTANLPAPVVTKPSTVMDVVTRTFTGATATVSSLAFSPDLLWFKRRDDAASHSLFDILRGTSSRLLSNGTNAEITVTDGVTSFDANGFTLGVDSGSISVNGPSGGSGVVWCWDAGSSTVTNTAGSISSQVRANASAGFSVIAYTGTGSNATVGHGLGVAPAFVIWKNRDTSDSWFVWHTAFGGTGTLDYMYLNSTIAEGGAGVSNGLNGSAHTSTVLNIGSQSVTNGSGQRMVAYAWAPLAGYSSFGSYTGNGSADGPFVYTGFRPRWILWKCTTAAYDWDVYDAVRDPYNAAAARLKPNSSDAEATLSPATFDILSNGFKLRQGYNSSNASGQTYIYFAVAESPFQYARAR